MIIKLVEDFSAKIVISSTWRFGAVQLLNKELKKSGLIQIWTQMWKNYFKIPEQTCLQIQTWWTDTRWNSGNRKIGKISICWKTSICWSCRLLLCYYQKKRTACFTGTTGWFFWHFRSISQYFLGPVQEWYEIPPVIQLPRFCFFCSKNICLTYFFNKNGISLKKSVISKKLTRHNIVFVIYFHIICFIMKF